MIQTMLYAVGLGGVPPKPADTKRRSSQWTPFLKHLLVGKVCSGCDGTDGLTGHHVIPFWVAPHLELVEGNIEPMCESLKFNCHYILGHGGDNWQDYRPDLREFLVWWKLSKRHIVKGRMNKAV